MRTYNIIQAFYTLKIHGYALCYRTQNRLLNVYKVQSHPYNFANLHFHTLRFIIIIPQRYYQVPCLCHPILLKCLCPIVLLYASNCILSTSVSIKNIGFLINFNDFFQHFRTAFSIH